MDRHRPRNPPARPLVLVVDSDDDTREMYAFALTAFGFETVTADDDAQALHRALIIRPDVIVTDLPRPNYDGWQLLHDLKEHPRTRDIPVVVVSGYTEQRLRERAERDGDFRAARIDELLDARLQIRRRTLGEQEREQQPDHRGQV